MNRNQRKRIEELKRAAALQEKMEEADKRIESELLHLLPSVYACIALALKRHCGWGYTRIERLFKQSQDIWETCEVTATGMLELCFDETGINFINSEEVEEEKNGMEKKLKKRQKGKS